MSHEAKKTSRPIAVFMAVVLLSTAWLTRCVADDKALTPVDVMPPAASSSGAKEVSEPAKASPAVVDKTKSKYEPSRSVIRDWAVEVKKPSRYKKRF